MCHLRQYCVIVENVVQCVHCERHVVLSRSEIINVSCDVTNCVEIVHINRDSCVTNCVLDNIRCRLLLNVLA